MLPNRFNSLVPQYVQVFWNRVGLAFLLVVVLFAVTRILKDDYADRLSKDIHQIRWCSYIKGPFH